MPDVVLDTEAASRTRAYPGMCFEVRVTTERTGHRWECLVFGSWRSVGGFASRERALEDAGAALDGHVGKRGAWETKARQFEADWRRRPEEAETTMRPSETRNSNETRFVGQQ